MKTKTDSSYLETVSLILVAIFALSLIVAMFVPVVIFFTAVVFVAIAFLIAYSCK